MLKFIYNINLLLLYIWLHYPVQDSLLLQGEEQGRRGSALGSSHGTSRGNEENCTWDKDGVWWMARDAFTQESPLHRQQ